uniref:LNP1 protein n=1 Tax=Steinernema glaseri TaxID=37863 RepID=A0A1I7ZSQ0_9BILA
MLRKPTWKRWRERRRQELEAPLSAPLATDDCGDIEASTSEKKHFNFKRRVMKSRLGKSLSRFEERRNSLGKKQAKKKPSDAEKECHSAVEFGENSSVSNPDEQFV